MQLDPMPYIISAAVIGTTLGYGIARWSFSRLAKKISKDTWATAERFYKQRNKEQ